LEGLHYRQGDDFSVQYKRFKLITIIMFNPERPQKGENREALEQQKLTVVTENSVYQTWKDADGYHVKKRETGEEWIGDTLFQKEGERMILRDGKNVILNSSPVSEMTYLGD